VIRVVHRLVNVVAHAAGFDNRHNHLVQLDITCLVLVEGIEAADALFPSVWAQNLDHIVGRQAFRVLDDERHPYATSQRRGGLGVGQCALDGRVGRGRPQPVGLLILVDEVAEQAGQLVAVDSHSSQVTGDPDASRTGQASLGVADQEVLVVEGPATDRVKVCRGLVENHQGVLHILGVLNLAVVEAVVGVNGDVQHHDLLHEIEANPERGLLQDVVDRIVPSEGVDRFLEIDGEFRVEVD